MAKEDPGSRASPVNLIPRDMLQVLSPALLLCSTKEGDKKGLRWARGLVCPAPLCNPGGRRNDVQHRNPDERGRAREDAPGIVNLIAALRMLFRTLSIGRFDPGELFAHRMAEQQQAAKPDTTWENGDDVGEQLKTCKAIVLTGKGHSVEATVADELRTLLAQDADIDNSSNPASGQNAVTIGIQGSALVDGPNAQPAGDWGFFRFANGRGEPSASAPHLLYPLLCRIREEWLSEPASDFAQGRMIEPQFRWLAGRDEFLTGRLGFTKRRRTPVDDTDLEDSVRELARLGSTHVVINELARPSLETGPDGEVYYRFYDYTPDIDQYVETRLNAGTYPSDHLEANLDQLKTMAQRVDKYGLIPGFYAAHPRSVPESLLARYPHLRGARIDHPFRAYRPRYTLSVAHPAVRWHYAELIRSLLTEVPELGFIKMLLNDSGSGFEYTASLYTGRNGGPYVVREWRPDDEIARLAAGNVIRYYRTLRDAAREVNPDFHLMTGLKNIAEEQDPILAGMDEGIDLHGLAERWLQNFPYHVQLGITSFIAFIGAGLLLATATVIYQTTRAAMSDPVGTLRAE
jgi:hypothetical protein